MHTGPFLHWNAVAESSIIPFGPFSTKDRRQLNSTERSILTILPSPLFPFFNPEEFSLPFPLPTSLRLPPPRAEDDAKEAPKTTVITIKVKERRRDDGPVTKRRRRGSRIIINDSLQKDDPDSLLSPFQRNPSPLQRKSSSNIDQVRKEEQEGVSLLIRPGRKRDTREEEMTIYLDATRRRRRYVPRSLVTALTRSGLSAEIPLQPKKRSNKPSHQKERCRVLFFPLSPPVSFSDPLGLLTSLSLSLILLMTSERERDSLTHK